MKRTAALLILLSVLLSGCSSQRPEQGGTAQYTATFLDLFDTLTTIIGRAESEEEFRKSAQSIHDELLRYHRLFDIYQEYEGMNNLCTINKNAGIAPVRADGQIIALLQDCRSYYEATGGMVNAAMGSVLRLWHDARDAGAADPANAYLPDEQALREAQAHVSFDAVEIDPEAGTVFLSDPAASLDVGAIAKGWAVQRVCEGAPEGMLISVGGNVCATGPKDENGTPWVIGIQDPDGAADKYLHTIYLSEGSVITSGDYQRAYLVDGVPYHHIIDPQTCYPASLWRSVSVVCADSALGDMLSTALFLLPQEEGQALLEQYGAQALWVSPEGELLYSPGFSELIRT